MLSYCSSIIHITQKVTLSLDVASPSRHVQEGGGGGVVCYQRRFLESKTIDLVVNPERFLHRRASDSRANIRNCLALSEL